MSLLYLLNWLNWKRILPVAQRLEIRLIPLPNTFLLKIDEIDEITGFFRAVDSLSPGWEKYLQQRACLVLFAPA